MKPVVLFVALALSLFGMVKSETISTLLIGTSSQLNLGAKNCQSPCLTCQSTNPAYCMICINGYATVDLLPGQCFSTNTSSNQQPSIPNSSVITNSSAIANSSVIANSSSSSSSSKQTGANNCQSPCLSCQSTNSAYCLTCMNGYTIVDLIPGQCFSTNTALTSSIQLAPTQPQLLNSTSNSSTVQQSQLTLKCASPCLTCSGLRSYCLSCVNGYVTVDILPGQCFSTSISSSMVQPIQITQPIPPVISAVPSSLNTQSNSRNIQCQSLCLTCQPTNATYCLSCIDGFAIIDALPGQCFTTNNQPSTPQLSSSYSPSTSNLSSDLTSSSPVSSIYGASAQTTKAGASNCQSPCLTCQQSSSTYCLTCINGYATVDVIPGQCFPN